jgi:SAM-dependent methyltransferase
MKEFWDQRYASEDYAYGEEPNEFFRESLRGLTPGRILLPADGEGRNGVYAATQGWDVVSFDISEAGRTKALRLAEKKGVSIDYQVASLDEIDFPKGSFDAVALIYAHFPEAVRRAWHRRISGWLRPSGRLILEAFSKGHLPYVLADGRVGGPRDLSMLYTVEDLREDFSGYREVMSDECEVELTEGAFHVGKGRVVRWVGERNAL